MGFLKRKFTEARIRRQTATSIRRTRKEEGRRLYRETYAKAREEALPKMVTKRAKERAKRDVYRQVYARDIRVGQLKAAGHATRKAGAGVLKSIRQKPLPKARKRRGKTKVYYVPYPESRTPRAPRSQPQSNDLFFGNNQTQRRKKQKPIRFF